MKRNQILMLLVCAFLSACDGKFTSNGEKVEEIINVEADDEEMNAAIEEARSQFDQFLKEREQAGDDFQGLLKVYFTDNDNDEEGEHMWVRLSKVNGEKFGGVLLSDPGWIQSVKKGQEVEFERSDVSDWLYPGDGKAVGAYTVRVLRARMSEKERQDHDSAYPFAFD